MVMNHDDMNLEPKMALLCLSHKNLPRSVEKLMMLMYNILLDNGCLFGNFNFF